MDFSKIRNYLFLGSLLIVTIVFLYLLKPFAYPIFWAAILAALFNPFYKKINASLGRPNLSALFTLLVIALIIILPLAIIFILVIRELIMLYVSFNTSGGEIGAFISTAGTFLTSNHFLAKLHINNAFITERLTELSRTFLAFIINAASSITQNSFLFLALFFLMLYTLFFFLRDGEKLLKKLMYLCPLGDRYEILLYEKFTSTASAALKSTLIVGTLQGFVSGILFYAVGIPGALIWGIIMGALSIIPATGSFLIWLPAGIIMLMTGHLWQGIVILLVGAVVISTIDNLLRPMLAGKDLEMPPIIILFSTLGGVALFGISGFVIGPIIAALFLAFWEMYEEYYHRELQHN